VKILDCTIRDGGLINDHFFDDAFVRGVWEACSLAGVDYVEMGYKASKKVFSTDKHGCWKFCDEDDIRRIVGDLPGGPVISVMADTDRTDYHTDILPREKSVIGCVRIAAYIHQIPAALDMARDAHDKGYETTLNLMAVSTVQNRELCDALELVAKSPVLAVYVVDSFGSFYPLKVKELAYMYKSVLSGTGKQIGIHAHNNQQLAYANTIEAVIAGANWLDATIHGLGRGAGNCPLELLIGFLKNPKFKVRPVLQCVQDQFVPLRNKLDWGYSVPYMITGQLNQHPRAAIKARAGESPDDYVAFWDMMMEKE
jgi:4-hydroxy 2-oxovalerate aldolase